MKRQRNESSLRATTNLWAMEETIRCFRGGCVPCAYKLMVSPPSHNKENPLEPLRPLCSPNVRPERCPRFRDPTDNDGFRGLYNKNQTILVVGDGNFSFSVSLASKLAVDTKIICTSFQSRKTLLSVYGDVTKNLEKLSDLGCLVLHDVDATNLQETLKSSHKASGSKEPLPLQFDRIIFNFPCISREEGLDAQADDTEENKSLLKAFLKCCGEGHDRKRKRSARGGASQVLSSRGEVHIIHKTKPPFGWWDIPSLCASPLEHIGDVVFDKCCYPGYVSKKVEDNKSFPVHDAVTHVFGVQEQESTSLPRGSASKELADGDVPMVPFDWEKLPRFPGSANEKETDSSTPVVKLTPDALWAVVSFLQFAASGGDRLVRLTKKGKRGGTVPKRRSKKVR